MRSSLITRKLRKHAPGTKYGRSVAPKYGDFVYVEGCPHVGCVLDANLKSKVIYHLLTFVFICLHLFYLFAFVFICLHLFLFAYICFFLRSHLLAFVFFNTCLPACTHPPTRGAHSCTNLMVTTAAMCFSGFQKRNFGISQKKALSQSA